MSGNATFLIAEFNNEELGFQQEHCADILDILPLTESAKPTYTDDLLTKIVYYRSTTQTEVNRVGETDITYDSECLPVTQVTKLYDTTDGTVLLKTVTLTYTTDGTNVTNIERTIT